jgi:hypothetical protein
LIPNLAGVLTNNNGTWESNGMWWDMRVYADMTGELVSTSGEVGTTAISASENRLHRRVVALLGDEYGYTGPASVTFSGLSSVPWLANNGTVDAVVYRIPNSSAVLSPQVVLDQVMSASSGSLTLNFNFQSPHDAYAIYLEPGFGPSYTSAMVNKSTGLCLDEPNYTTVAGAQLDEQICSGGSNQAFTFTATGARRMPFPPPQTPSHAQSMPSPSYFVHPMTPDYCVGTSRPGDQRGPHGGPPPLTPSPPHDGAAVGQHPCAYSSNQQFTLRPVGTNAYQVVTQHTGLCIAPTGGAAADGTLVVQVPCGTPATIWIIKPGLGPNCCTLTLQRLEGNTLAVRASFTNPLTATSGTLTGPANNVALSLKVPAGLTATATTSTTFASVPPGGTASATWDITGPADTPGALQATATSNFEGEPQTITTNPSYLSLASAFNDVGVTSNTDTGAGNLDGNGFSFSAQALAAVGVTPGATIQAGGLSFIWPNVPAGQPDNVVAGGQQILLTGTASTLGFLMTGTYGPASGTGTIYYTDGTSQSFTLTTPDWYGSAGSASAVITAAYRNGPGNTQNNHPVSVFYLSVPLAPGKTLGSVLLPNVSAAPPPNGSPAVHVFAISMG